MGIFDKFFKPNIEKLEERRDVKGLIKAIKYKDEDVREKAADALFKIGDKNRAL